MNFFDRLDDRHDNAHGCIRSDHALFVQIVFQKYAVYVFHYDVGCSVLFKKIKNVYNVFGFSELCHALCFQKETLELLLKLAFFVTGEQTDSGFSRCTVYKTCRIKFFYCNHDTEGHVKTFIGNSESSHTNRSPHNKPIPQDGSRGKVMWLLWRSSFYITAVRAYFIRTLNAKTIHAQFTHTFAPLFQ